MKEKRTYDQRCGLAIALDAVGERWTLLLVRELLVRPRRYGELLEALPGIGTNLLAERLASLTAAGVIRPIDPERRGGGYALTPLGEELRRPVTALARLGLELARREPQRSGAEVRASWAVLAVEALVDESQAPDVDEAYEFAVDDEVFHVAVAGRRARVAAGAAADPTLRITTAAATFFDIGTGRLDPLEALLDGSVTASGPPAAVVRCLRLLGLGTAGGGLLNRGRDLADTG